MVQESSLQTGGLAGGNRTLPTWATRVSAWAPRLVVPMLFAMNAVLFSGKFALNLADINPWDEAYYVFIGKALLLNGRMPTYAQSPLPALFYAPIIAVINPAASAFWLLQAASVGHFVLFGLLWLAAYRLAREFAALLAGPRSGVHPAVVMVAFAVSPVIPYLLGNSSDSLFAALSTLALAQLLAFARTRRVAHLWPGSAFLGLAALARNDGLIMFAVYAGIAGLLSIRPRILWRVLPAALLPYALVLGGYLGLHAVRYGRLDIGMGSRSYQAFEQGHQAVFPERFANSPDPTAAAIADVRRLYGTPQENQESVVIAIRRNPGAFAERVARIASRVPQWLLAGYGQGDLYHPGLHGAALAVMYGLMALRGLVELARRRLFSILGILLLWPLHLAVYSVVYFRPGYFQFHYAVVFALAATGLAAWLSGRTARRTGLLWTILVLAAVALTLAAPRYDLLLGELTLLGAGWLAWAAVRGFPRLARSKYLPWAAALALALLLKSDAYPIKNYADYRLGATPNERTPLFLRANLPWGTIVGASTPAPAWMANMEFIPLKDGLMPLNTEQAFDAWLARSRVRVIYVDVELKTRAPLTWAIVQGRIGKDLELRYSDPVDARFKVLYVKGSR